MKKRILLLSLLIMASMLPLGSDAHTRGYYRNATVQTVSVDDENQSSAIRDASKAVVRIFGYKQMPAYVLDVEEVPGTKYLKASIRQSGIEMKKISSGSAFFVTSDGYLLTNKHVVGDESLIYKIDDNGVERDMEVIYKDPVYDLAVLKVSGSNFPTVKFDASDNLEIGEHVVSIGNALGRFSDSISLGSIVSLDETVIAEDAFGSEKLSDLIVTDARLYPGDSGGPLLNGEGQVIGVNVAIVEGTNISFSIPAELSIKVLRDAGIRV